MIVPKLEGSRAQRIVVLEGDPDRETFVKRWTSEDKHVRAVVQSTGVSTEEEDLDDLEEVEGEDLPRSDRSSEDEEEEEGNEDAKGEGEGDEDEEGEEEDDNAEDEGDSDASEGNNDDEGGDGGEGAVSKSASDRAGSSERTYTKEGRIGGGGKNIHGKGAESEVWIAL